MIGPIDWEKIVAELESRALAIKTSESAKTLKSEVQEAITEAENNSVSSGIIDRLDQLMMAVTELSRENVCTNTRCPHYDKKMQDAMKMIITMVLECPGPHKSDLPYL